MTGTKLIAAILGLVGAADVIPTDMIDPIARVGATGVLGFLVIWLVMKTLPAKDKAFAESVDNLAEAINKLRENCAAVRKD